MSELLNTICRRNAGLPGRFSRMGWPEREKYGRWPRSGCVAHLSSTWTNQATAGQPIDGDEETGLPSNPDRRDAKLARLEAVLFIAREPIHSRKMSQFANLADGTEARTLAKRLNEIYDASGRAFRIYEVAGGFQLRTRPQFAPWLRRLRHAPSEERLSAPLMETLAVVAYRQPVVRAEIEAIRGVACGEVIRQLMEREMVKVAGRSPELGRPFLYCTTNRFLELFGLGSLDELPRADIFRNGKNVSQGNDIGRAKVAEGVSEEGETEVKMMHGQNTDVLDSIDVLSTPGVGSPVAVATGQPSADVTNAWDEDEDFDDDDDDDDVDDDVEEDEWEDVDDDEEEDDDYEYEYEDDDDDDDEEEAEDDDLEEDEWEEVADDEEEDDDYDYEDDDDEDEWDDDDDDWEEED